MKEVPQHIEDQVNGLWELHFVREITAKKKAITDIDQSKHYAIEDVQELVSALNGVIYQYVGPDQPELYNQYKTHLIRKGEEFLIIEGEEVDTDPHPQKGA